MEGIYETNDTFPFEALTLTSPTVISGGNYFIKYLVKGSPLYVQTPKCKTKGGVSKHGKRGHCDLVFTNDNEEFIRWMESLERHTCQAIYQHREKWFETEMDLDEIENYFASPLKIYKSGKFYLARTNIGTRLGKMTVKIYNENEEDVDPETIGENTEVITILEVQGIKCSARSFQLEMELKQMMVLKPENIFERCILGKGNRDPTITLDTNRSIHGQVAENVTVLINDDESELHKTEDEEVLDPPFQTDTSFSENSRDVGKISGDVGKISGNVAIELNPLVNTKCENLVVASNIPTSLDDFEEVVFNVDELPSDETVHIKTRNDVYYEMYREAKQKAKMARNMALAAYLEAKQIKETYQLEDSEESDEEEEEDKVNDLDN